MIRAMAVGALLAAVALAPHARADDRSFLDAVAVLGYTDRSEALRNGYTVCVMRTEASGDLTDRVLREVLSRLDRPEAAAESDEFAALAVKHLCPELA
jgi:hypothetical protein